MDQESDNDLKEAFKAFHDELWLDHERNAPSLFYHYTGEENFRKIVLSGELWASDICGLNDPSEGRYAVKILGRLVSHKSVPKPVIEIFQKSNTLFGVIHHWHEYVACFSEDSNSKHQWNKYADSGNGVALGIDSERLFNDAPGRYAWVRILYDQSEQVGKLSATVDRVISTSVDLIFHSVILWTFG